MQKAIIVGAGHAAAQLAPRLRKQGWSGEILIIGEESYIPYQRPSLSKAFLSGSKDITDILIRPRLAYEQHNIAFMLNKTVINLYRSENSLALSSGEILKYDKLALCTGSRARTIALPGSELAGIFYLRTLDDVNKIKQSIQLGQRAVIVGGGYIGLETAAVLVRLGLRVTVLEAQERVLARVTAPAVSAFYTRIHLEEGVEIKTGVTVSAFEGETHVATVRCANGDSFSADLVIVGVGVLPNVELAKTAGLTVDNGIVVDEFAATSDPNIVAAGDCTNHPNQLLGKRLRLESVQNAMEQANTAAANLCGIKQPYMTTPWFWSDQYNLKLQIAGLSSDYDQVILRGDSLNSRSFVAWYCKQGELVAADCINRPKEFMVAKQLLNRISESRGQVNPHKQLNLLKLADESVDPKTFLY